MNDEIEQKIIDSLGIVRDKKIVLFFSCGADSTACYLRMKDWGIKPFLLHRYYIYDLPLHVGDETCTGGYPVKYGTRGLEITMIWRARRCGWGTWFSLRPYVVWRLWQQQCIGAWLFWAWGWNNADSFPRQFPAWGGA
jgi:hypothetical protein